MREQRRLSAIVSADVVGYSRLMGRDEAGTLAALKAVRSEVVDPKVAAYGGRLVKTMGDGLLLEFASVVDAVRCVIEVQAAMSARNGEIPMERRIEFRIGVNIGDIIIDGDDIFGDGVNVAARLQELADSGGICMSGRVQEDLRGKLDIAVEDGGEQQLKNIAWPVRVYRLRHGGGPTMAGRPALALPDKPSIAVLPFTNMSGDPEQEYFADGITEDIITALSRFRSLFVIARNSTFTYKGKAVDVRAVGRELGVRYVLEGSVRKAASTVRISGQLVQADSGAHIWADRYDGALADIFDLQDKVTSDVVGAVGASLEQAEIERVRAKPTENLGAYDLYLRGMARLYARELDEACQLGYRAIELDPNYAAAYAMLAFASALKTGLGIVLKHDEVAEVDRVARRAVELGRDDALVLSMAGWALAFVVHDLNAAVGAAGRAIALNPNLTAANFASGWLAVWGGFPDKATEHFSRAIRLSPLDANMVLIRNGMAHARYMARSYDEAILHAELSLRERQLQPALRIAAASAAFAGRNSDAGRYAALMLRTIPDFRLSRLADFLGPYQRPEDLEHYKEGLRRAGLPE
jgi:TolB-like protein/class 3 adenylate cyclase/Tfp pilus assembly protein PilF